MSKYKLVAAIVASVSVGFAAGYLVNEHAGTMDVSDVSSQFESIVLDSERLPISGSPIRGGMHPDVVIVAFVDFSTPNFEAFHKDLSNRLFKQFGDRIAIVYKNYPLVENSGSMLRAQAAMAAHLQHQYWPMADALIGFGDAPFDRNQALDVARKLGLDIKQFSDDLDSPKVRALIQEDLRLAELNEVHETPTIFVNGIRVGFYTSNVNEKELASVIKLELNRVEKLRSEPGFYYFAATQTVGHRPNVDYDESVMQQNDEKKPALRTFVDISGTPTLGNPEAPVVIVEFADFEDPVSAANTQVLRDLMKRYPDKFRIVFKHRPVSIHPHARAAHQAAEAASLMGNFWGMHDALFAHQDALETADLKRYATELGLDATRFEALMNSSTAINRIEADLSQGTSVKVSGAPGYFINGRYISGAIQAQSFERILNDELVLAEDYLKKGTNRGALYQDLIVAENEKIQPHPVKMEETVPAAPIVLELGNSIARGPENAPVVIYQFSDLQCPFSARVEPTVAEIEKIYGDKVRIVFKNYPLQFHKNAGLAAEALLAAAEQGKFAEMRDSMFKFQNNLSRPALEEFAKWAGLDMDRFKLALDNHQFAAQVAQEVEEGKRAGIQGTPAFVINGRLVVGAKSVDEFKSVIDEALKNL